MGSVQGMKRQKNIVYRHGPEKLKDFPGFHDEKLRGKRKDERSSRLSKQYRVIYSVKRQFVTVFVLEITLHQY
jgi:plasmid maintenance system killer protein